jgi:hypothetical protein
MSLLCVKTYRILFYFPMIPGKYLWCLDVSHQVSRDFFIKDGGLFKKWNTNKTEHFVFLNAHPSQMKSYDEEGDFQLPKKNPHKVFSLYIPMKPRSSSL